MQSGPTLAATTSSYSSRATAAKADVTSGLARINRGSLLSPRGESSGLGGRVTIGCPCVRAHPHCSRVQWCSVHRLGMGIGCG